MRMAMCSKILQELELIPMLKEARRLGFEGVEIFGVPKHLPVTTPVGNVKDGQRLMDDLGLTAVTLCSYVGDFEVLSEEKCRQQVEEFTTYLDFSEILHRAPIRVNPHYWGREKEPAESDFARFAHWAGVCADLARERGLSIILENNLNCISTLAGTRKTLEMIARPNVFINYDPGNVYRSDPRYGPEMIHALGRERIGNVQIKDARGDNILLLLGEGEVDYPAIIDALRSIGYDGWVSAECHREPDGVMSNIDIARHEFDAISRLIAPAAD